MISILRFFYTSTALGACDKLHVWYMDSCINVLHLFQFENALHYWVNETTEE